MSRKKNYSLEKCIQNITTEFLWPKKILYQIYQQIYIAKTAHKAT